MEFKNINIDDLVKKFLMDTSNMVLYELMCEQDDSFSGDGMEISKENGVDCRYDVASVMVSPFSKVGFFFVRGDRENPFLIDLKALLSPI